MNTSTITIHFFDDEPATHEADYFISESEWTTLKTVGGRQIASYPSARVKSIVTSLGPVTPAQQMQINGYIEGGGAARVAAAIQANAKYSV